MTGPQIQTILRRAVGEFRFIIPGKCGGSVLQQTTERACARARHVPLQCVSTAVLRADEVAVIRPKIFMRLDIEVPQLIKEQSHANV